jgi:hypothetical protein
MDNQIQELFALPIGLKPVTIMDDIPLYGSQSLNEKFIEAIGSTKRGQIILNVVIKMINDKTLIPCFSDKGILTYFKRRLSKNTSGGLMRWVRILVTGKKPIDHPFDNFFAVCLFPSTEIIIFINNHIYENFSLTASNLSLATALTHEMMHKYAHLNHSKFYSLFKDELNSYYKHYFTTIFKLKDDKEVDKSIERIIKFLIKMEMSSIGSKIPINPLAKELYVLQEFSNLNQEEYKTIVIDYIKLYIILISTSMGDEMVSKVKKYKYIISCIHPLKEVFPQSSLYVS